MLPLVIMRDDQLRTIPVGLMMLDGNVKQWGPLMAGYAVARSRWLSCSCSPCVFRKGPVGRGGKGVIPLRSVRVAVGGLRLTLFRFHSGWCSSMPAGGRATTKQHRGESR